MRRLFGARRALILAVAAPVVGLAAERAAAELEKRKGPADANARRLRQAGSFLRRNGVGPLGR